MLTIRVTTKQHSFLSSFLQAWKFKLKPKVLALSCRGYTVSEVSYDIVITIKLLLLNTYDYIEFRYKSFLF